MANVTDRVSDLLRRVALSARPPYPPQDVTDQHQAEYDALSPEEQEQFKGHYWTEDGIITEQQLFDQWDREE